MDDVFFAVLNTGYIYTSGRRSLSETSPLGKNRMLREEGFSGLRDGLTAFASQVSLSCANLTTVYLPERAGDNGIAVQDQLFDELVKKALATMQYNKRNFHNKTLLATLRHWSGF